MSAYFRRHFSRGPEHRHNHRFCGCSHRRIIVEGTIYTILEVAELLLCCPLQGFCFTRFYLRQWNEWYKKVKAYESPKTQEKKERERIERAARKKAPRMLLPRIGDELFLTIGKEDEDVKSTGNENGKGKGKGKRKGKDKGKGKVSRIKDAQKDCVLFHLPLEVRRLIWEEVTGGYIFHMRYVEAYKRMRFTRCKHEFGEAACAVEECGELMKQKGAADKWGNIEMLSLLQTCRLIYSEAVDVLYRDNTFCFASLSDVMSFSLLVLPSRMNMMQNVRWKLDNLDPHTSGEPYSPTRPWLECVAPEVCECIECWHRSKSLAVFVNRDYLAAAELQNRREKERGEYWHHLFIR